MQPHLDTLHSYSMSHEHSDCAGSPLMLKALLSAQRRPDQCRKVVHTVLRALSNYWDEFFKLYDSQAKPSSLGASRPLLGTQ